MEDPANRPVQAEPASDAISSILKDANILDVLTAPLIYFEGISNQGGIDSINMTLISGVYVPVSDGTVKTIARAVAHLRCSREAAVRLRNSIDAALAIGEVSEGPKN